MKLSGSNISKDLISDSPYHLPHNSCDVNMKAIFAVMNTTWAVVEIRPEKNSGLYRIWTHDCNTVAVLHQLGAGHYVDSK